MLENTKTRDWEMSSLAQVGGAALVGGGVLFFCFRNPYLKNGVPVLFSGGGIGLGGSFGGASIDEVYRDLNDENILKKLSFSSLDVKRPFSLADLHNSVGTVSQVAAGLAIGGSLMTVTAGNLSGPLFDSFSIGVALLIGSFVGVWSILSSADTSREIGAQTIARELRGKRVQCEFQN